MRKIFLFIFLLVFVSKNFSQVTNFNLEDYKSFLQQHQNMTYQELQEMNPAGVFQSNSVNLWNNAIYKDLIMQKYSLTDYELELIRTKGFVVSERLSHQSFLAMYADIYHSDLPAFISTDAILHAFHQSYDKILKDCELGDLIPRITSLLDGIKNQIPILEQRYTGNSEMLERIKDLDFYIGVPRKLLNANAQPYYSSNIAKVDSFTVFVYDENPQEIPFLSIAPRKIDFSQFKPRGHYVDDSYPQLASYFRALMWLGRMELYLISPSGVIEKPKFDDVKRQIIVSYLMLEALEADNSNSLTYQNIEDIINFFVGYQDNVTLNHLKELKAELNIANAGVLTDSIQVVGFQNALAQKSYAAQMILSQMLSSNDLPGDSIKPASAFMLYGQRFVVDSYVTGSVVYDKIRFNGAVIRRMLPNPLDVVFALGNNAALQLLSEELEYYNYSQNLAALRYLIDSYQSDFWNYSFYNSWLNAIKQLNPPEDRSNLPPFMQTGAWWQQKINTQLASWAELRHDNLLYAKQSYTGIPICSFPYSYVEPYPNFYLALKDISERAIVKFNDLPFSNELFKQKVIGYFNNLKNSSDTLSIIASKELSGTLLNSNEGGFLTRMMRKINSGCALVYDGWYPNMYYTEIGDMSLFEPNYIIADYHTSPADESGAIVGWVKHAGTGKADLLITAVTLQDGQNVAFVGPAYSFYDYLTTNFLRLTDEEWKDTYLSLALRPDWVNSYLANNVGESRGPGSNLITSVKNGETKDKELSYITAQNYPNPFNASTLINFNIPMSSINQLTKLSIYNVNGELIKVLINQELQPGNYVVSWDATNGFGNPVAGGVYLYELKCGNLKFSSKMIMVK